MKLTRAYPLSILCVAAAVAVVPWIYAARWPTRDTMTDLKWALDAALIAAFGAATLAERRTGAPGRSGARRALFVGAALAGIGGCVSALASPAPSLGLRVALRDALFILFACRLASMQIDARSKRALLAAYAVSAALQSALGIAQFFLASAGASRGLVRATMLGTLGNPEHVAGWVAPALAIAAVWLAEPKLSGTRRAGLAAIATLVAGFIVLSGGRGAALSAGAAVALAHGLARRTEPADAAPAPKSRAALLAGAACVAALAIAAAGEIGTKSIRQGLLGRAADTLNPHSVSMRHRIGLLAVNSRMILRAPLLGTGPGRFGAGFDEARGRWAKESAGSGVWMFNSILGDQAVAEAHCDPLQWWAERGAAPFLGLALILASTLAVAGKEGESSLEARMILAAFAAMAVGMLFSFPLHRPSRAALFWALAGLAHAESGAPALADSARKG